MEEEVSGPAFIKLKCCHLFRKVLRVPCPQTHLPFTLRRLVCIRGQPVSRDGSRSRRVSIDESLESGPNTTQNSPQLSPLRVPSLSDMRSPSESRGRRKASGFSLASVSNAIMDVVRSSSPRNRRPFGAGSRSTERDFHLDENSSRGRTREKAKPSLTTNDGQCQTVALETERLVKGQADTRRNRGYLKARRGRSD